MADPTPTTPTAPTYTPPPPLGPTGAPSTAPRPAVAPAPTPATPPKPKTAFTVVAPKETPKAVAKAPAVEAVPAATDGKEIIPRAGVLTVAMVTTSGAHDNKNMNAVVLPKDAVDLDVVEVHRADDSTGMDVAVYPNKGEAIGANPISDGTFNPAFSKGVSSAKPVSFRKMSKTLWAVLV